MANHNHLRTCEDDDDGMTALCRAVEVLSRGVAPFQVGVLQGAGSAEAHQGQWEDYLECELPRVQRAMGEAYQAASEMRLEDIVTANATCLESVPSERRQDAHALASIILGTIEGARHARLTDRLLEKWRTGSDGGHPAIAFAVKAGVFHESLVSASVSYFYQEWRASAAGLLHDPDRTLELFLESKAPSQILSLSPTYHDPQSPFQAMRRHG